MSGHAKPPPRPTRPSGVKVGDSTTGNSGWVTGTCGHSWWKKDGLSSALPTVARNIHSGQDPRSLKCPTCHKRVMVEQGRPPGTCVDCGARLSIYNPSRTHCSTHDPRKPPAPNHRSSA